MEYERKEGTVTVTQDAKSRKDSEGSPTKTQLLIRQQRNERENNVCVAVDVLRQTIKRHR